MSAESGSKKRAVLLVNVGTPDSPEVRSVRKYLSEFLNDSYVIDLPWVFRKILVNLIIVPFRAPKSARLYQQLWKEEGSPLLIHSLKLKEKLGIKLGEKYTVFVAMRYGNPSIQKAMKEIAKGDFEEVILLPLFPQYATSTTETAIQKVYNEADKLESFPNIRVIKQFYNELEFLNAWNSRAQENSLADFDHVVFSFHGLPLSHIEKVHPNVKSVSCTCETNIPVHGTFCYKASCYATARLLVDNFGLKKDRYSVSFQSRLTKNWLSPFTDELLVTLAEQGKKRVLIFAPSFVADCLETKVELEIEYRKLFINAGGEELRLVASLNDSEAWVNALDSIIRALEN